MATEKAFLVKLESGEELGPMDTDALVKMAENGTITADAQIRSTLIPLWQKAREMDCLKKIYRKQLLEMAEAKSQDKWAQMSAQINLRGDYDPLALQISQEGITYSPAGFIIRFLAGIFDLGIAAVICLAALFIGWGLLCVSVLPESIAFTVTILLAWSGIAAYYCYMLNTYGQTLGQRFWGLVVITPDLRPVYPGRAFPFLVLTAVFGLISPVTWLLTGCRGSLQEVITGTKVRKIFIARKR